jgi:uncharacterized Zn finger protein
MSKKKIKVKDPRVTVALKGIVMKDFKMWLLERDLTITQLVNQAVSNEIKMIESDERVKELKKNNKKDTKQIEELSEPDKGAVLTEVETDEAKSPVADAVADQLAEIKQDVDESPCKHRWTPDSDDKSKYYCEFCGDEK